MQETVFFLCAIPGQRVAGLILDGVRRYSVSRRWDVALLSWKETGHGALRDAMSGTRPVGFVAECGDMACTLPPSLFGTLPAVFVNCADSPRGRRFANIPIDSEAIAHAAFEELSKGRPPAYAVVDLRHAKGHWPTLRVKAFKRAVAEANAKCHAFIFKDPVREDVTGETERLSAWLAGLPRRTAVFAVNDQTSADVVEAARLGRLRIPQDLTLLGVDNNLSICEASKPTLSSIQVDFENAGYQAARELDCILAAKKAQDTKGNPASSASFSVENMSIAIGPMLAVRRESTRGFGRRNPDILHAVEIIRREACDGLTARRLISRFPGSRWLFEMRFREAMGHSVLDEIQHVQLEKVCTMLATTDISINAVGDFCGFGSGRALRDCFRKRIGMSMREFRERNRR